MESFVLQLMPLLHHLAQSPLFGLTLTVGVFWLCHRLYQMSNHQPLLNPVLWSIVTIGAILMSLKIPYANYFEGGVLIHSLLGPATVALAIPLYRALGAIRSVLLPLCFTLCVGSAAIIALNITSATLLEAPSALLTSLAPKSATAPVAIALAETNGGIAALSAVFAILTGVTGAVFGGFILSLGRVYDPKARGFAIGLVSHGIGTARQLTINETSGAFSGLGMGLNALMTALLLPFLLSWLT